MLAGDLAAAGISCAVSGASSGRFLLVMPPDGHATAIRAALDRYCGSAADHVDGRASELTATSRP